MRINFYNQTQKEPLGYVEIEGKTLRGSNEITQKKVTEWKESGGTAEEFVTRYASWSNGFLASLVDGSTPADD